MPKRKREPSVNVTVNISGSILKFAKPVPIDERFEATNKPATPDSLFPKHEVIVRAQGSHGPYIAAESKRDGTLLGKCSHCTREKKSIEAFAPSENVFNCRRRPDFFAALDAYTTAYAARDLEPARAARDTVVELRSVLCTSCHEVAKKLSPKQEACKAEWERMRKAAGVCATAGCCENGPNAWEVLQANHLDPEGRQDPANKKVHRLSDYTWWSCQADTPDECVAEMRKEAAKCNFLCSFCHRLDEHSTSANRNGDPATMPLGKLGKTATKEEINQYKTRHRTKICFPKQQFVDAEKLRRGCCANPTCRCLVTPDTCVAFPFDHRDETTKLMGEGTLAGIKGGVSGLVHNHTKRAALNKIKPVLVAEMEKCRLLCENCHHRRTWYGLVINTADEVTMRC